MVLQALSPFAKYFISSLRFFMHDTVMFSWEENPHKHKQLLQDKVTIHIIWPYVTLNYFATVYSGGRRMNQMCLDCNRNLSPSFTHWHISSHKMNSSACKDPFCNVSGSRQFTRGKPFIDWFSLHIFFQPSVWLTLTRSPQPQAGEVVVSSWRLLTSPAVLLYLNKIKSWASRVAMRVQRWGWGWGWGVGGKSRSRTLIFSGTSESQKNW